jgi:Flp pilus assembly protein TadG
MRIRGIERSKADRGSALVELSLILFMFIIMLFGVVELGRLVLVYTAVANAARCGARYAIVHGGDQTASGVNGPSGPGNTTQVQTVVQNFASSGLLDPTRLIITVAYPNGVNSAGSPVSVTVSYPYDPLISYFNSSLAVTIGSSSQGIITF